MTLLASSNAEVAHRLFSSPTKATTAKVRAERTSSDSHKMLHDMRRLESSAHISYSANNLHKKVSGSGDPADQDSGHFSSDTDCPARKTSQNQVFFLGGDKPEPQSTRYIFLQPCFLYSRPRLTTSCPLRNYVVVNEKNDEITFNVTVRLSPGPTGRSPHHQQDPVFRVNVDGDLRTRWLQILQCRPRQLRRQKQPGRHRAERGIIHQGAPYSADAPSRQGTHPKNSS